MLNKNKVLDNKKDFRALIINGALCARKVLEATFGPHGGTVAREKSYGGFSQTKDGKNAIESIKLENNAENFGAEIIKNVCNEMDNNVGDNTTTAGIFASALIEYLYNSLLSTEKNILEMKAALSWSLKHALKKLQACKVPIVIEEIIGQIATISANNNQEYGNLISKIHKEVPNPSISVELSRSLETSYDALPGLVIDSGCSFIAPTKDEEQKLYTLENPYILVTDNKINHIHEIRTIIEDIAKEGKSLVIFAPDFDAQLTQLLWYNAGAGIFKSCLVKASGSGDEQMEILKDIATLVGADLLSFKLNKPITSATVANLGCASIVRSSARKTQIINNDADQDAILKRVQYILQEATEAQSEYTRKKLETRAQKLKYGTAVIRVGGITDEIASENKDLVEDAVKAVVAALEGGVIPGGGVIYLTLALHLQDLINAETNCSSDFRDGVHIIIKALTKITKMLMRKAFGNDEESYDALNKLKASIEKGNINYGYNLYSCEYVDLVKSGIFDTLKAAEWVLKLGIENAATRFLNTESMIINIPDKEDKQMNPY